MCLQWRHQEGSPTRAPEIDFCVAGALISSPEIRLSLIQRWADPADFRGIIRCERRRRIHRDELPNLCQFRKRHSVAIPFQGKSSITSSAVAALMRSMRK